MRGEASADDSARQRRGREMFQSACAGKRRQTVFSLDAETNGFQSACAGKRRQTVSVPGSVPLGGFQSACAGKRRQTVTRVAGEEQARVSGRVRGEASADFDRKFLTLRSAFQSACAGKRRQTFTERTTPMAVTFQSACAGKRRQTWASRIAVDRVGFSPHARGSVGRLGVPRRRRAGRFSPHARGSVGRPRLC